MLNIPSCDWLDYMNKNETKIVEVNLKFYRLSMYQLTVGNDYVTLGDFSILCTTRIGNKHL